MRRLFLAVVTGALVVLGTLSAVQAVAQSGGSAERTDGVWKGSHFTASPSGSTVSVSGTITHQNTSLETWTVLAVTENWTIKSDNAGQPPSGCAPSTSPVELGPASNSRPFTYTLSSPCNLSYELKVSATARSNFGRQYDMKDPLIATVTVAAPPKPVTAVTATVPGTTSKDVTVSWAVPDGTAPDTTYVVQRKGPGEDAEWTSITDPFKPDPANSSVTDTVEADGRYRYRVVANRPKVDSVYNEEAVAQVHVGKAPVTETPDTGSQSPVTQPGSGSTITVPRLGSTRTPNRVSTHTTVVPQGPPTTIDTGFEETLDYGDLEDDDFEPGELAAEGQSIIGSDDESVIGPGAVAASLLVMFGWAGHVVYVRRLAAQF